MRYESWEVPASAAPALPGVPALLGRVLAARGLTTEAEAREFLRTDPGLLHDPMLLAGMQEAVARLERALSQGETIAVYGDYDVDGVTATCLLYDFFRRRGGRVLWYIPRRLEDGYGLNCRGLDALKQQGAQLVVTVDCGITAVDEVEYARELGMEVIITDHHACKETLPDAVAVVDPHRADCPYPFKGLAGVGVAMKLAMAMGCGYEEYVSLAALGTVADVMPLVDENRAMVHAGLERINAGDKPGIQALLEAAGAAETVTAVTLGYGLAPRLNAAGRLGVTEVAVELLLSPGIQEAMPLAQRLCELNRQRQALEGEIFGVCEERVLAEAMGDAAIVLHAEGWHQGVVGIVASRLADKFHKPTFMISLQDGMGKGSCRGVDDLSVFEGLQNAAELLEGFGGHAMAAGFTVRESNIPALKERLCAWAEKGRAQKAGARLHVDVALDDPSLLSVQEVEALERLEPYGCGNPKPVFCLSGTGLCDLTRVGVDGKHLRLRLKAGAQRLQGIYFSCPKDSWDLRDDDVADVAFVPQINDFRGKRTVQLVLQDARRAQGQEELCRKFYHGEDLTPGEALALIPSRGQFETLWRRVRDRAPMTLAPVADIAGDLALGRAVVGLEVFYERGLIDLSAQEDRVSVTLRPRGPKVDLEQSPILIRLHGFAEEG